MKRRYKITAAMLAALMVYIAANTASIYIYAEMDEKRAADTAIILGAAADESGPSPVYRERINHGIELYNDGYVGKLIMTGGTGEGNTHSDAYIAKQYAVSQGIPDGDILTEDTSTITQENLENSKLIMDENGFDTAIIVSDPLHMRRAMLLARDAGITAYSSPTPTTMYVSAKTKFPFLAREVFFYIGYKWWRLFS